MKRLFYVLVTAMMAVNVMAEEQPKVAEKSAQLVCIGNTYYYGSQEVMNKRQMLDWYARHNCQAAYDQFDKGRKLAIAGWACLGIGLAMDVGCIVSGALFVYGPNSTKKVSDPAYIASMCLGVGAFAFEIACVPTLIVGYHKMHHSVDVYNIACKTASIRPYWTLQASSNGIGLAMKF